MLPVEPGPTVLGCLQHGDEGTWSDLDRELGKVVLAYCRRRGLQWADAQDVKQRVMTGLLLALPRFCYDSERGSFRSYLRRVVANAVHRHWRRRAADPLELLDVSASAAFAPESDGSATRWQLEWMNHHLETALEALSGVVHAGSLAVFAQLLAGRTVVEIARESETSPARIHKIKQRVGRRLQERVAVQIRAEERSAPPPAP